MEARATEIRPDEVCTVEYSLAEVRSLEVRLDFRVSLPPLVCSAVKVTDLDHDYTIFLVCLGVLL